MERKSKERPPKLRKLQEFIFSSQDVSQPKEIITINGGEEEEQELHMVRSLLNQVCNEGGNFTTQNQSLMPIVGGYDLEEEFECIGPPNFFHPCEVIQDEGYQRDFTNPSDVAYEVPTYSFANSDSCNLTLDEQEVDKLLANGSYEEIKPTYDETSGAMNNQEVCFSLKESNITLQEEDCRVVSEMNDNSNPSSIQASIIEPHSNPSTPYPWSFGSLSSINGTPNGFTKSGCRFSMGLDVLSQKESLLQFQKGKEEASKFLPKNSNIAIDLEHINFPNATNDDPFDVVVRKEKDETSLDGSRGSKIHYREVENLDEGRGRQSQGAKGGKGRPRKQGDSKNVVDLRALLILCAQSTASDDHRTADELLKQIREHSSVSGDGSQRLAHYFANALEARLAGTGSQNYTALNSKRTAVDMMKAYMFYIRTCPMKKSSIEFANCTIYDKAARKASKLHIIDFGILYGFQWAALFQRLSTRPGGPPKLRITGIDLPQPAFQLAERLKATGRSLAKYCERFNIPFEFRAISQKWETIRVEDLKLESDEVVAVNCLYRFKNLLDETIVVDSLRSAVLKLIRKIEPHLFVHGVVNGSYNAPFFVSRFREALFHYSTLFDMFDTNTPRDEPQRLMFEEEFYGREIMNVVACEGTDRVERPETYKQWQVRINRAGFKQLPLDQELIDLLRKKAKVNYRRDFVIDVDGHWTLHGPKGRITHAVSAWVPA